MAGLCDALFQAPQRLTREGMAVIDTPRHGFWAALPHCEERPLTLFRFPRPVALFFRGQVVRQRPFQRAQRHPGHVKDQGFGHRALPFLPSGLWHASEPHRWPTAHHASSRNKAALVEGGLELPEEVAMMLGCTVVHLPQTFGEAKVLPDVAAHRLILSRRVPGAPGHGPTPSAAPQWR